MSAHARYSYFLLFSASIDPNDDLVIYESDTSHTFCIILQVISVNMTLSIATATSTSQRTQMGYFDVKI